MSIACHRFQNSNRSTRAQLEMAFNNGHSLALREMLLETF